MCCRAYVNERVLRESRELTVSRNPQIDHMDFSMESPGAPALVIAGWKEHLHAGSMVWGLPLKNQKGLVINTRSETAQEKPLFRESILHRRCVLPVQGFWEWDTAHRKVRLEKTDQSTIFLAGLFSVIGGGPRFSVLTVPANESVRGFHERMPLILEKESLSEWVLDDSATASFFRQTMPELTGVREDPQMSIFD